MSVVAISKGRMGMKTATKIGPEDITELHRSSWGISDGARKHKVRPIYSYINACLAHRFLSDI